MKKAKELVQELQEIYDDENPEDVHEAMKKALDENLKPEINNLLFQYLPDNVSIKDAEILATIIYRMIRFPDEFFKK